MIGSPKLGEWFDLLLITFEGELPMVRDRMLGYEVRSALPIDPPGLAISERHFSRNDR